MYHFLSCHERCTNLCNTNFYMNLFYKKCHSSLNNVKTWRVSSTKKKKNDNKGDVELTLSQNLTNNSLKTHKYMTATAT